MTMGAVAVPERLFIHFARGLLDGDGNVRNYVHHPVRRAYPSYTYERLVVRFYSASAEHLTWVRAELSRQLGIRGALIVAERGWPRVPLYTLQYSKYASQTLLTALYADRAAPRLERKWRIWNDYSTRHANDRLDTRAGVS